MPKKKVAKILPKSVPEPTFTAVVETLMFEHEDMVSCLLARQAHHSLIITSLGAYKNHEIELLHQKEALFVTDQVDIKESNEFFEQLVSSVTGFNLSEDLLPIRSKQWIALGKEGQEKTFCFRNKKINVMVSCFYPGEIVLSIPAKQGIDTIAFYKQVSQLYPVLLEGFKGRKEFVRIIPTAFSLPEDSLMPEPIRSADRWCLYDYMNRFDVLEEEIIPNQKLTKCPLCGTYYFQNRLTGHIVPVTGTRQGEGCLLYKNKEIIDFDGQAREKKQNASS